MTATGTATTLLTGIKRLPRKIFGTRNDRLLKVYNRQVRPVNTLETDVRGEFDEQFAKRVAERRVDEAPEEERETLLRALRVEFSERTPL